MIRRAALLLGLLCICATAPGADPSLPAGLARWHFGGEAVMRFFGLKIYDIRLFHEEAHYRPDAPFALELKYARNFSGTDIVKRSLDEMRAQGYTDETQLSTWRVAMSTVIPDVRAGDRLLGVAYPGREAQFFADGRPLGTIDDPAFVTAFFDIWMSERTSAPTVRARLLADRR